MIAYKYKGMVYAFEGRYGWTYYPRTGDVSTPYNRRFSETLLESLARFAGVDYEEIEVADRNGELEVVALPQDMKDEMRSSVIP